MGINLSFVPFFDVCNLNSESSPMYMLGTQDIHDSGADISRFAETNSYAKLAEDRKVRSLMQERYGITEYFDCDINARANVYLDLNKPLDSALNGAASVVIDAGTIEHVFNASQAFINVHEMTKPDGMIIHIAPVTWLNHAYYNFNPKTYKMIGDANGYELISEAYHFLQDPFAIFKKPAPALFVTHQNNRETPASNEISRLLARTKLPCGILYMIAYRKRGNADFVFPYDAQD